jgi:uncharacterized coiled-coil DUF342 family protein
MKNTKFDDFDLERQIEELKKTVWDLKEKTDKYLNTVASNYVAITKINKTIDKLKMAIKKLWGAIKELRREVREKESSIF